MGTSRTPGRRQVFRTAVVLVVAGIGLINIAPVLWGVATSVRPPEDIISFPPSLLINEVTGAH